MLADASEFNTIQVGPPIKTRVEMQLTNKVIQNQLELIDSLQSQALRKQDEYFLRLLGHAINDLEKLLEAFNKGNIAITLIMQPHE